MFLLIAFSSQTYAFDGPLRVKNQFPLFMYVDAPYLEKAAIENSFSASFSYSSIYLVQESSRWSAKIDMEIAELNLIFRKSFKDFIELTAELPIVSFNSGIMDGFLNGYHNFFGLPDYGRSERPANKFLYEVRRRGNLVVRGESGRIELGDIKLSVKKPLIKHDPFISVRGEIEFPTGDAESGYGNGSLDAGLSLLIDKQLSEKLKTYVNLGVVSPGDFKGYERVDLREFIHGGAALEATVGKDISIIGQVFVQGSPLPKSGIGQIDRTAVLISLGGRYRSGNSRIEFSLTEDPNTAGAPDFTCNFTYRRLF